MKNTIQFVQTLILLLITAGFAHAQTVHVVNNNTNAPDGGNVYTVLQDAVDAANAGDIIHVVPSNSNYGSTTITKKLSIYGIGFNPDKELPQLSEVLDIIFEEGEIEGSPSGSRIEGLSIRSVSFRDNLNDLTIRNNIIRVEISSHFSSDLIEELQIVNNVFNKSSSSNPQIDLSRSTVQKNTVIANNIFSSNTRSIAAENFTLIQNNLFLGNGDINTFGILEDCIVANNIFFGMRPSSNTSRFERNIFNNNLTVGNDNNSFPINGSNTGSNNLEGINPQFISLSASSNSWDFNWDPGLQQGSPAIGAGSDGTDIGLFGGSLPFNSLYTGGTPLPLIHVLNTNGTIQPGQDLQINVQARSN